MSSALGGLQPIQPMAINPATLSGLAQHNHPHSAQAGPSSENGAPLAPAPPRRVAPAPKRKRSNSNELADTTNGSTQSNGKSKDGPKKKKASRACALCQKAHLTCDDSRPCQRCVKRGVADQCVEGHRKRAKYLLDEEEIESLKRKKSGDVAASAQHTQPTPIAPAPAPPVQLPPLLSSQPPPPPPLSTSTYPFPSSDPLFSSSLSFDPTFSFGSEAANLEYSILSAILGKPSPESQPEASTNSPASAAPNPADLNAWDPSVFASGASAPAHTFDTSPGGLYTGEDFPGANFLASPAMANSLQPGPAPTSAEQSSATGVSLESTSQPLHPLAPRLPPSTADSSYVFGPAAFDRHDGHAEIGTGAVVRGDEVYGAVTKAYDYTKGYHLLMQTIRHRFDKNDILRIVRALAIFRPSLIALQMPLTEEDEVFVEKSLQRSLIELDKLISYVGTPTVVWRRTGEICLVGPEFCMLTEWPKEDLLGKNKYIWELFENQSVVEYWENFATHAFENTTQSVYSHCVLLKPDGTPVPATFCFHIRRDIFDLPSLVIGACPLVYTGRLS
ncbi:hypothetical protein PENSPDRAFT_201697 [Peniophora sp. CONT]|nr:hypothetical protein PENSPDRAFT_201697 [Peniophora sp. CONT]